MQNMILIKEKDRSKFEKMICKIPTHKIIGEPKTSRNTLGEFMFSAFLEMSPLEIEKILEG